MGLFTEKQLLRMADTKLIAEVCDALLNGVRTTNRRILDRLYTDNDRVFAKEKLVELFRVLEEKIDHWSGLVPNIPSTVSGFTSSSTPEPDQNSPQANWGIYQFKNNSGASSTDYTPDVQPNGPLPTEWKPNQTIQFRTDKRRLFVNVSYDREIETFLARRDRPRRR